MRLTALCATVILAAAAIALAAPPETMSYQGVLKDDVGSPVPDGTYDMHFAIYDAETAGNTLWSSSRHVAVTDGIFNVILGSDTPLDLPAGWSSGSEEEKQALSPSRETMRSCFATPPLR